VTIDFRMNSPRVNSMFMYFMFKVLYKNVYNVQINI